MPMDLLFARHGNSEPNVINKADKSGEPHELADLVFARHDSEQRLTAEGIEQAIALGEWIETNIKPVKDFDERFVSPLFRTCETAAYVGGPDCTWLPDVRLAERDWGIFGTVPLLERQKRFSDTEKLKLLNSFFTRFDGGESIHDMVYRLRDFMGTLSREWTDKKVLAIAHGEVMWGARFLVERMLPQEWSELDKDRSVRIGNCALLWYTRQNPEDPADIRTSMSDGWRRMVDPVDPTRSPYGGEWQKLQGKRHFSGRQLLLLVEIAPPLLLPPQIA